MRSNNVFQIRLFLQSWNVKMFHQNGSKSKLEFFICFIKFVLPCSLGKSKIDESINLNYWWGNLLSLSNHFRKAEGKHFKWTTNWPNRLQRKLTNPTWMRWLCRDLNTTWRVVSINTLELFGWTAGHTSSHSPLDVQIWKSQDGNRSKSKIFMLTVGVILMRPMLHLRLLWLPLCSLLKS